ncbi:MAG: hypothetical protein AAF402_10395 [Pseudomonadota bacterium]
MAPANPLSTAVIVSFWLAVMLAAIYKLWMTSGLPMVFSQLSPHDITWFFEKATSIAQGNWFGDYDHFTLIKGPMFPLFLVGMAEMGLHPRLAFDLIYVVACIVFALALTTCIKSRIAIFLAFMLLLMNPVTYSMYWGHPLRQALFMPTILVFLSATMAMLSIAVSQQRLSLRWSLVCGISLAIAWNTREESIWMLGILFPALCVTAIYCVRHSPLRYLAGWLLVLAPALLVFHSIASINLEKYGYYGTVDIKAPGHSAAMRAILSLNTKPGGNIDHLTVEVREKMLTISNHTNELFDKMIDEDLRFGGIVGEVNGTYALWMVRDGMADLGYYESFATAESAYYRIAADIRSFCDNNPDECRWHPPGTIWKNAFFKDVYPAALLRLKELVSFNRFQPNPDKAQAHNRSPGDNRFVYAVGRFFNQQAAFAAHAERYVPETVKIERDKHRAMQRHYGNYSKYFVYVVVASIVLSLWLFFVSAATHRWNLVLFGGCFLLTFAVLLAINLTSVRDIPRLTMSSVTPMLCFCAYAMAAAIDGTLNYVKRSLGIY